MSESPATDLAGEIAANQDFYDRYAVVFEMKELGGKFSRSIKKAYAQRLASAGDVEMFLRVSFLGFPTFELALEGAFINAYKGKALCEEMRRRNFISREEYAESFAIFHDLSTYMWTRLLTEDAPLPGMCELVHQQYALATR